MPPKKDEGEGAVLLGRPGNNVKAGIVGLPNVGKSSLFNILCSMQVRAENFPFCTIEPTVSRVALPDERFDWLVEHCKPAKQIPAFLNVTDIAGLIKGAHKGEGLGNAFLSHINACDAIFHVVRVFDDAEILHVDESVDPIRDMQTIAEELRLKDVEAVQKEVARLAPLVERGIDKTKKVELEFCQKVLEFIEQENHEIRFGEWTNKEVDMLNNLFLLTAKPVIYLLNLSENDYIRKKNKWLAKIVAWLKEHKPGDAVIPMSVKFEEKLGSLGDEAEAYCKEKGVKSALPKVITTGYEKLNLINFFTCGKVEVRAWTIRRNTKAPQAAAVIHTDFEKFFIMAEVMAFDDFKEQGSEAAVVAAGKLGQRGKDYVVQDGDILNIKHNAGGAGKKK